MESYLSNFHYDLVTPDGRIIDLYPIDNGRKLATVLIEEISPAFVGYQIDAHLTSFNLKSTLAQLGLHAIGREYEWDRTSGSVRVKVELQAIGNLSSAMLD